jgi:hypothetical protein
MHHCEKLSQGVQLMWKNKESVTALLRFLYSHAMFAIPLPQGRHPNLMYRGAYLSILCPRFQTFKLVGELFI